MTDHPISTPPANDTASNDNRIADDLLFGAARVAAYTGLTDRQIYHLSQQGVIPVFRMGATLCARKSTWLAWIEAQEQAACK